LQPPPASAAASKAVLGKFCTPGTTTENQGGRCRPNKGLAVNDSGAGGVGKGDVYLADAINHRIQRFDKNGGFQSAWGIDVIASGKPGDLGTTVFEVCAVAEDCKAGTASAVAGGLNQPWGVAVDQDTGVVYVTDKNNRRIDAYSATGEFQGAFGWKVIEGSAAEEFQFCTSASGCQAAPSGKEGPGALAATDSSLAVAPSTGSVYVPDPGNARLNEFSVVFNGEDEVVGASFVRAIGWDVIPLGGTGDTGVELEVCTDASGCKKGTIGAGAGQFSSAQSPGSVAVDSNGHIYAVNLKTTGSCEAGAPCGILKFNPDGTFKEVWGPSSGECQLSHASGSATSVEAFEVAVNPSSDDGDNRVVVARKTGDATTMRVLEFDEDGSAASCVQSPKEDQAPLATNAALSNRGLAVSADGRAYVHTSPNAGGEIYILGLIPPPPPPTILPATEITATGATLHGEVTVAFEGLTGFDTSWRFEYSSGSNKWTSAPSDGVALGSTPGTHVIEQEATGLEPNTEYAVRLAASSNGGTTHSEVIELTTATEAPTIESVFSETISRTEMMLGAEIDPNSLPSSYHFEWGTEPGVYPNRVPAFERQLGSGSKSIVAQEGIGGLQPATVYHYRVVAQNAAGAAVSEDNQLLTLNASGLSADRGVELVSPADKGSVGSVVHLVGARNYQAAENVSGFAFPIFNGLPEATSGGIVTYRGMRTETGWSTEQVAPPSLISSPLNRDNFQAEPANNYYYSPDLGCAVLGSTNPLTADTPEASTLNGMKNLYRWNGADGSYTLITKKPPINPVVITNLNLNVAGASDDCSRVIFHQIGYSFIPGGSAFYEWDGGALRDAGLRPDGSNADPDSSNTIRRNAVSSDGRFFFVATSNEAADNGKPAVFVRKGPDPGEVVNASYPTPGNTSLGARYETASPDGSHVFFLANYGLTPAPSNGPVQDCGNSQGLGSAACDLYDYDVEAETLTSLTAGTDPANPSGAVVQGVLDVSRDGSVVYFAARGQLVPGKGRSYQQNSAGSGASNVYRYHEGEISYVGTLDDLSRFRALIRQNQSWESRTTKGGEYLVFPSADDFDGKNPGKVRQAYLYSAQSGRTVCVSCPRDHAPAEPALLPYEGRTMLAGNHSPRSLSSDGRVFFESRDRLLPGAIAGVAATLGAETTNVYEWHRGQLSLLSTGRVALMDIRADGTDVYLRSFEQLVPEDIDFASDIYDLRIGSVTPPPVIPEVPCEPGADQCQGAPTPAPAAPSPASSSFSGSGNPPPPAARKAKKNKKKAKKNRKRQRRAKQRKQRAKAKARARKRAVKINRGGAK
jgi:hypothetical protein